MFKKIVVCDVCQKQSNDDAAIIEINRGTVGPFIFVFRGEPIKIKAAIASEVHFCGSACMLDFFERRAREQFKEWVNKRDDLDPHEIIRS